MNKKRILAVLVVMVVVVIFVWVTIGRAKEPRMAVGFVGWISETPDLGMVFEAIDGVGLMLFGPFGKQLRDRKAYEVRSEWVGEANDK